MPRKKAKKEIKEEKVEISEPNESGVELVREGSVSGEYVFKTKGRKENGWTVSAQSLEEAYEKAERVPMQLRN